MNIIKNATSKNKGFLIINYPGLGDAIMSYPAIYSASFDKNEKTGEFIVGYPKSEIFNCSEFINKFPIPKNFIDFNPNWYKFDKLYWREIINFTENFNIGTIINLQNEGELYDKNYYHFKENFLNRFDFWDLDFKKINKRVENKCIVEDMKNMLVSHGVSWKFPISSIKKKSNNIVFYIGSSEQNKIWDKEKWIHVIRTIRSWYEDKKIFVLTGNSNIEKKYINFISKKVERNLKIFFYQFNNLNENISILKNSELIISHDTYPVHLASLLSLPIFGIYISTDPIIWGSFNNDKFVYVSSSVECADKKNKTGNCVHFHSQCPNIEAMRDSITVDGVLEAIRKMLK